MLEDIKNDLKRYCKPYYDGQVCDHIAKQIKIVETIRDRFGTDKFVLQQLKAFSEYKCDESLRKMLSSLDGVLNLETEKLILVDLVGHQRTVTRYIYSLKSLQKANEYIKKWTEFLLVDVPTFDIKTEIRWLESLLRDKKYRCNFIQTENSSPVLVSVLDYMEKNVIETLTLDGAKELYHKNELDLKQLYAIERKVKQIPDGTLRLTPNEYEQHVEMTQERINELKKELDGLLVRVSEMDGKSI